MLCSSSRKSEARLHFSGLPTNSGTIWVSLDITGRPAAVRIALTRAARSWWRSRSQFEVLRWRIAAGAPPQNAGGRAGVEMKPGAQERAAAKTAARPAIKPPRQPHALG